MLCFYSARLSAINLECNIQVLTDSLHPQRALSGFKLFPFEWRPRCLETLPYGCNTPPTLTWSSRFCTENLWKRRFKRFIALYNILIWHYIYEYVTYYRMCWPTLPTCNLIILLVPASVNQILVYPIYERGSLTCFHALRLLLEHQNVHIIAGSSFIMFLILLLMKCRCS